MDPDLRFFGASKHHYQLAPVIDEAQVQEFERRAGVILPEDYRRFVTRVGNGGAGPGEGLLPLGYIEGPGNTLETWSDSGFFGAPAFPFPHRASWNFRPERLRPPALGVGSEAEEAWHDSLEATYWTPRIVDGAIPIAHHGFGLRSFLVVTGPERGTVWLDARSDWRGLHPEHDATGAHLTFARWYRRWLHQALADAGRRLAQL